MKRYALLSVIGALTMLSPASALAAEFDSIGSLSRFYNDTFAGRESNMKWFFFGGGEDTAAVWEGAAVTIADAVWPEFNGEWYLKAGIAEHWELWDTPAFDNVQAIANGGRPGVSDGDGIPGAFVIAGHPGFVQGTDTIADNDDPRPSVTGNPSHMWAPGNDNGNQFQSPHTTIEVKLPGNTDYTGTEVELVESVWTDLHAQTYYLEFLANDGGATRHLIWADAAFTVAVVPANPSAAGDIVDAAGGNGGLLPVGYLFAALNGRLVGPPPAVLNVDTGETFATIQEAIDDADTLDGHTLEMQVPDHSEGELGSQIVFSKNLTLRGASPNTLRPTGDTGTSGDDRAWFLIPAGKEATFEDLIFDGTGFKVHTAMRSHGTLTVTDCDFTQIRFQASGSPYAGIGVQTFEDSPGGPGPLTVSGCNFSEIGRIGVFIFGPALVENCTYTGKGIGDWLDYFSCVDSFGDSIGLATFEGCTVSGNRGVALTDGSVSGGFLVTTFFGAGTEATITDCSITDNTIGVAVGFNGADTSLVDVHFNNIAGNEFGVVNTAEIFPGPVTNVVNATDNWWGDAGGPHDPDGSMPAMNGFCVTPVDMIFNDNVAGDTVTDANVEYCPWAMIELGGPPTGDLIIEADDCQDDAFPGETGYQIEVTLSMRDLTTPATGYQAFLKYDDTNLTYRGDLSSYAGPFPLHIGLIGDAEAVTGEISLNGSDDFNDPGTVADSLLATLVFDVDIECTAPFVDFDLDQAFDSELSFEGDPIPTGLTDSGVITVDDTAPVLAVCPDITVPADANVGDGCVSAVVEYEPTATDNCTADNDIIIGCDLPSGSVFLVDTTTTVTCTATDDCGNVDTCMFDVTVTSTNSVEGVKVQLVGSTGPVTRCIHFVADDCSASADIELDFDGTGLFEGDIEIPCGPWTVLCAKDEQHTKWDTLDVVIVDTHFTSSGGTFFLEPGDNDNDGDVDINDVTWLLFTFGNLFADGGCDWDGTRDADYDNNGAVGSNDYSLLSGNWLTLSSCTCVPGPFQGGDTMLATSIPTDQLEPAIAASVDLNGDAVFNAIDVEIFEAINGLPNTLSGAMRAIDLRRSSSFGR